MFSALKKKSNQSYQANLVIYDWFIYIVSTKNGDGADMEAIKP